jgi:NADH-ubiquinone oxidoreductase chain 4L
MKYLNFLDFNFNPTTNIMGFSFIIFVIGIAGFLLNSKNLILMLISIEIMLLGLTLVILISAISLDDILGEIFSIYLIIIAGAESAIGLSILVSYYKLRGNVNIDIK